MFHNFSLQQHNTITHLFLNSYEEVIYPNHLRPTLTITAQHDSSYS